MKKIATNLPGLLLLEPRVFGDDRGFFLESYNQRTFAELGIPEPFVQDNHSYSEKNVIRGLHYQIRQPQGKLVRAITGEILDVALDLRRAFPTFGKWESFKLSGDNKHMLWIPRGFAHGFRVVSQTAHVLYKTTDFHAAIRRNQRIQHDQSLHARLSRSFRINRIHLGYNPLLHGFGRDSQPRLGDQSTRFQFVPRPLPLPPSQASQRQQASEQRIKSAAPHPNSGLWHTRRFRDGHRRFRGCRFDFCFFFEIYECYWLWSGPVNPKPDHSPLLNRLLHKLKPATQT